jgi:lysophospholipase L1-like esterase
MDWYEPEVQALERSRSNGLSIVSSPVFYGSSSFRLWDTLAEDFDSAVVNLAFGGSTLEACDHFFERIVKPANPLSLTVYAGDNDLGDGRTPEEVAGWYRSLAEKARRLHGDPPFGFISIKPSPARWAIADRIRRANSLIRNQARRIAGAYFIDVFPAMLDASGAPSRELFSPDGLHLSRSAYHLWGQLLKPYRNRIFPEN